MEKLFKCYRKKIERILSNKLQSNSDNEKAVNDVKVWLCCEWQCGTIEDMHYYTSLLKEVDIIANKMIKEL